MRWNELFLGHSHSVLVRNKAEMMFFNFLNFYIIFLEFSKLGWVGTDSKRNFFLHSFSAFPVLFWLEIKPEWCFLIFWIFILLLWNFLDRVGLDRTQIKKFLLLILNLPRSVWARNKAGMMFFNFLNFYTIFFEIF